MEPTESNTVTVMNDPMKPISENDTLGTIDEENDCPIEEVRLTVPIIDDPTLPCLTFRTWVLGVISCAALSFLNQFFGYRQNALSVTSVSAQILVLPLGKLMAASLPRKAIRVPGTKWSFSLNPGPFNLKEHCLITIFANAGTTSVYAVNIITIVKAFYHRQLNPVAALLLTHTTQMLGYGWAGIFRKYLVDSPYMWWPANLVQVSLFRALHEVEIRPKGGLTRLQFFIMVLASSFSYYIIPNYLFPSITALSFVCWIWKDSVTAQQIGSGLHGLGLGSFALDWSTVAGFLGSPLATPGFAIVNMLVGFVLVVYVALPVAYWTDLYGARKFPIISSHVFDANGKAYNISEILIESSFEFNRAGYDGYSKVNLSVFFVLAYGLSFAGLAATVSHVALFHGSIRLFIIGLHQTTHVERGRINLHLLHVDRIIIHTLLKLLVRAVEKPRQGTLHPLARNNLVPRLNRRLKSVSKVSRKTHQIIQRPTHFRCKVFETEPHNVQIQCQHLRAPQDHLPHLIR
ncbi:oligopeptide transporter [Striga asiatica]|uniref:Oligopeptide transporter n=1 Tax=Striga asiatica TaxID=4170 RepID=A0A5A7R5X9_STRAF|nr:oligopeptide transporter [Striga asiatica]